MESDKNVTSASDLGLPHIGLLLLPYAKIMSATQPPPPPPPPADLPHDSLRVNIIVSTIICWFIAAFFVTLRVYTRGFILRVFGPSDWSILLALVRSQH